MNTEKANLHNIFILCKTFKKREKRINVFGIYKEKFIRVKDKV